MQVSFIELHRNQIRDLLTEEDNSVRLRECPVNGPYVENITCATCIVTASHLQQCCRRRTRADQLEVLLQKFDATQVWTRGSLFRASGTDTAGRCGCRMRMR